MASDAEGKNRRRVWIALAIAAVLLFALVTVCTRVHRFGARPDRPVQTAEAIEADAGSRSTTARSRSLAVARASATDGGAPVRPEPVAAALPTPRVLFAPSPCAEPPDFEMPNAPSGYDTVAFEGVRVAFAPGTLTTGEARDRGAAAAAILDEAARLTGTDRRVDLLVVIYPDEAEYRRATGSPDWAAGAFDDAVRIATTTRTETLRHELLHAQVASVARCTPYWLDEGLASYFEDGSIRRFWQWLHMLNSHIWIPMASLVAHLRDDEGMHDLEPPEVSLLYGQSAAMIEMLVDEGGPNAIARAIAMARQGVAPENMWDGLMSDVGGEELLRYLVRRFFPSVQPPDPSALQHQRFWCRGEPLEIECGVAQP